MILHTLRRSLLFSRNARKDLSREMAVSEERLACVVYTRIYAIHMQLCLKFRIIFHFYRYDVNFVV